MPNLASAKKNLRKSKKKSAKNRRLLEKIRKSLQNKGPEEGGLQSLLDKAAKAGVIHRNKARRLKSRLYSK